MVPSLAVIFAGFEPTRVLVLSQVLLSFGLPVTIFSLLRFTADRKIMGELVNRRISSLALGASAALITGLNVYLIIATLT